MIACFLSNISAKYYKNPSMLSRVIAKNVGDVFFETQCMYMQRKIVQNVNKYEDFRQFCTVSHNLRLLKQQMAVT